MSNLVQYAKALVSFNAQSGNNGAPGSSNAFSGVLAEEASVTVKRTSNAQQVKTVAKGFAGMSQGAPMTEIDVSCSVRSSGFELDVGDYILNNLVGQLVITLGDTAETFTCNGFFTSDNFSHAVDTASKYDFTFVGGPTQWENG